MKLVVLGGGGVRTPMLAKSIAERSKSVGLNKICFMDSNEENLRIYGKLAKKIAWLVNERLEFDLTSDPVEALKGADFIITTLRVGQDRGRILDERIALKYGILGQETTGAGGFAMAMRSIPVISKYCKLVEQYANPGALVLNFTNPSGLVTQAMRDEGFENVYGICDGTSGFIKELEKFTCTKEGGLSVECFGLNHLSWYKSVRKDGRDLIHNLINDSDIYIKTEMRLFDPELVKSLGMFPNSYLYYYYYREKAIENIKKSDKTRGETIAEINNRMHDELCTLDIEKEFEEALKIYLKYHNMRESSYMRIEAGDEISEEQISRNKISKDGISKDKILGDQILKDEIKKNEVSVLNSGLESLNSEGYAGVALDFIESYIGSKEKEMVLIIPNNGSIDGIYDNDIIEVTCHVTKNSVTPIKIGRVPEIQMYLIRQVKLFERLASHAIRNRCMKTAISALMVHPLINSYTIAKQLVKEFIEKHSKYIGKWE